MDPSQISAIIAGAVAIASFVSSVITTMLNNRNAMKLRKLELEEDKLRNSVYHKRDILENYLKYAGQLVNERTPENLELYGSYYLQALLYVDNNTADSMQFIHDYLVEGTRNKDDLQVRMFMITSAIKATLEQLQKQ